MLDSQKVGSERRFSKTQIMSLATRKRETNHTHYQYNRYLASLACTMISRKKKNYKDIVKFCIEERFTYKHITPLNNSYTE